MTASKPKLSWTVLRLDVPCCFSRAPFPCVIRAGEPAREMWKSSVSSRTFYACRSHYTGPVPIDWQEIELERFRLEEDLRREAARRLAYEDQPRRAPVSLPYKPPRPYREVSEQGGLFDPKAAASGDRD